jgi:hypothetical protein
MAVVIHLSDFKAHICAKLSHHLASQLIILNQFSENVFHNHSDAFIHSFVGSLVHIIAIFLILLILSIGHFEYMICGALFKRLNNFG